MQILKVSYTYFPYLEMGGPPAKVRALAEGLAGRGHDVTVLTADFERPSRSRHREIGGVEVRYLRSLLRHRYLTVNPGVVPFCRRHLDRFDIIHIYGFYDLLGPAVSFHAYRSGRPYVLEPLGMFRPVGRSLIRKWIYHSLLGAHTARGASRIVATSDAERNTLVEEGLPADRIVLRRNGIELEEFADLPVRGLFRTEWGIRSEERIILFLGRLARVKGIELLLRSYSDLDLPGVRLVIAGPDEGDGYGGFLREEASHLGIADSVVFTGGLLGPVRLSAYVDADVLAVPSLTESFGNVVIEAAACGLPAVVTEECGVAAAVMNRAGLVVPRIRESMTEALRKLLIDEELHRSFQVGGRKLAQEYTWDAPLGEMERMYEEVLR